MKSLPHLFQSETLLAPNQYDISKDNLLKQFKYYSNVFLQLIFGWLFHPKMNVFNETKTRLAHLGLGTNQFTRIAGKNIPRLFIRVFIILSSILLCLSEIVLFTLNDNLNHRLLSVAIFLGMLPIPPIYISLVSKTNQIDELFSYLENVINSSNRLNI